jgi:hypothetical protein
MGHPLLQAIELFVEVRIVGHARQDQMPRFRSQRGHTAGANVKLALNPTIPLGRTPSL